MKRLIWVMSMSLLTSMLFAKELHFVYIEHSADSAINAQTNTEQILSDLKQILVYARDGEQYIVYLANLGEPLVAYLNVEGKNDTKLVRTIEGELIGFNAHGVDALTDLQQIISIFESLGIYGGNTGPYDKIVWSFYVTPNYWFLYKESIIAKALFALDFEQLPPERFLLQLLISGEHSIRSSDSYFLGERDLYPAKRLNIEIIKL